MKKTVFLFLTSVLFFSAFAKDSTFYFTTSDQVKLYVRVAGQGRPCVFVHGCPGSTSYYFEAMAAAPLFLQQMKMVYFDQRGSGRSASAPNGDYSLQRMEKDMEELRAALGFKQWAVMGHSFGGLLITGYAHDYPQSVSALLMIHGTLNLEASMNSHLDFGLNELGIKDSTTLWNSDTPLMERVGKVHQKLTEKNLWYKLMFRNAYEKQYSDSVTFAIGKFNREYANKVWDMAEYRKDFTPLTAAIRCPVLVMTGDRDYAIGPEHYKSFRFPHQTVVHYIGGHAPFQEEPQWFAEKILGFMSELK